MEFILKHLLKLLEWRFDVFLEGLNLASTVFMTTMP